jgi:hypothetical protein
MVRVRVLLRLRACALMMITESFHVNAVARSGATDALDQNAHMNAVKQLAKLGVQLREYNWTNEANMHIAQSS